ncbi:MAG: cytidylate kinase-like family protein [Clostridia bacterium]|nr:cytidylate kinase-like family protein [Clostridia bacterium]
MNKVITIGREFGSGGRELGRRLAEELGYEYYDKEIIVEIAKKTSLSEQYVQEIIEKSPHALYPITVAHSFSFVDTYAMKQTQTVFSAQEKVLKEMAEKSNCVIVGRCADVILKDYHPFKIFVYASLDSRVKRCIKRNANTQDLTEKKVRKYIKSIDKGRAKYYSFYTGKKWGNKLNYDIGINTTDIEIKEIIPHLASMIK